MSTTLPPEQLALFLLALGVLLGVARLAGELAERLGQPAVLGELLAGVLLGPTCFGALAPASAAALFPLEGPAAAAREALATVAILFFLTVSGLGLDVARFLLQWRTAAGVSLAGIALPLLSGFGLAALSPVSFGWEGRAEPLTFALFVGTALSISALPVIAKTLADLRLQRTDLGMLVIGSAALNDLVGWMLFALVVVLARETGAGLGELGAHLGLAVLALGGVALFARVLLRPLLARMEQIHRGPAPVVAVVVSFGLFTAALTEWLGLGALVGAFLAGVALGGSVQSAPGTLVALERFVAIVLAPLFFATIGLHADFTQHFDPGLVVRVFGVACLGKVLGCWFAARVGGLPQREAWAVGFGMNARGAMEMALALVALQLGLIGERLFVALLVMAVATSAISGPVLRALVGRPRPVRLRDYLSAHSFRARLEARDRDGAIRELAALAAASAGLEPGALANAVLARERIMPTGLGGGVAVPHARMAELRQPAIALGLAPDGIDFAAPDGQPARAVVLIALPDPDRGEQLQLLSEIALRFSDPLLYARLLDARDFEEVMRALAPADTASDR